MYALELTSCTTPEIAALGMWLEKADGRRPPKHYFSHFANEGPQAKAPETPKEPVCIIVSLSQRQSVP